MPILIVEHNGTVEGASLSGRVLIGRRGTNHVVVDDARVSRIHAWIDTAGGQFCLTDAGSRTGTFINTQRVTSTVPLRHGDRIGVGPAVLTFRADASLPAGVSQLDFGRQRFADVGDGVSLECSCGAPLWAPAAFAGRAAACRSCGATVDVPARAAGAGGPDRNVAGIVVDRATNGQSGATMAASAPPVALRLTTRASCGACQAGIDADEELATCPACGLTFHAECWAENYGCSAYGCSHVNALLPKPATGGLPGTAAATATRERQSDDEHSAARRLNSADNGSEASADDHKVEAVPREYLLLAGSVAGLLAGLFTFGATALLALTAVMVYLKWHPGLRRRGVAWAAAALAAAGVGAGVLISYVWWLGGWSGLP